MNRFEISVGSALEAVRGASIVRSADGSLQLAVLGASTADTQASEILAMYLRNDGINATTNMRHPAHVVLDRRNGSSRVVAPPVGIRQIYWSTRGGNLRLASEPAPLAAAGQTGGLPSDALFQYVYFHCLPGPRSAFAEVSKLDGGHVLSWDGRQASIARTWLPEFRTGREPSLQEMKQRLHEHLADAVSRSMKEGQQCGAFLSGGLDSSTVAGFAAKQRPGIKTISMGFDAAGYDEIEYARIAARQFGTTPIEYYVSPDDVAASLPGIAAAFPEPFGNSSAAAVFHCARLAREHGLDTLLAGDGGDEIFGGNDRYARQLVFERFFQSPAIVRSALGGIISAAAAVTHRFPVGKALSYVQQASVPLPDRLQSYNFLHRMAPGQVFETDVLQEIRTGEPLRLLREEYHAPKHADPVDRMLFMDWKFTLHDNDLVKVNTMCDMAGVQVAYPMLDPALIEFSMQVPSNWKVKNGQLRWFFKQAMRDFLPAAIINKTKHGFGLPFGTWMRTHQGLRCLAEDALASLAKRRYFRPAFLEEATRLHRDAHASYYGELVWILTVLELWLQHHMPKAGR